MNYRFLLIYNNNSFYKFKLKDKKYINKSLFLIYKYKNLTLPTFSILFGVPFKSKYKLYQLTYNIKEFNTFIKNNKKYYQQIYNFLECKIILRFNLKFNLEEICIEIFNNNFIS
jgi:hypothetical protein